MDERHATAVADAWEEAARRVDYRAAIHPLGSDLAAYRASGETLAAHISDLAAAWLPKGRRRDVIEVGVGDGRIAGPLARLGWKVTGLDTSPTMLRHLADNYPEVDGVLIDPAGPLPKLRASVVFAVAVLIHQSVANGQEMVREWAGLLRPGGVMLLHIPLYDEPREGEHWTDVTVWTVGGLRAAAESAGLIVERAEANPGVFSFDAVGPNHAAIHVLCKPER
jgi:SAM-dependent methyltransferase